MSKNFDALKVISFFVTGNIAIGFAFRSILLQLNPSSLTPTVLMPAFGLQATFILFLLSKRYQFNFYLNRPGFSVTQFIRGLVLSIVFAAPVLATVIAYSGGEFRVELDPLSLENNKALFFIALAYSEELIFRGLLLGIFISMVGAQKAIIFQAVLFASAHWLQDSDPWLLVWRIYIGYFYGLIAYKSNSLLPSLLVHTTWNFCLLIFSALSRGIFGFYGASVLGVFVITSQVPREVTLAVSMFGCTMVAVLVEIFLRNKKVK